jgi:hypothetical protein
LSKGFTWHVLIQIVRCSLKSWSIYISNNTDWEQQLLMFLIFPSWWSSIFLCFIVSSGLIVRCSIFLYIYHHLLFIIFLFLVSIESFLTFLLEVLHLLKALRLEILILCYIHCKLFSIWYLSFNLTAVLLCMYIKIFFKDM